MNTQYISKKTNYDFAVLKNENKYCCSGTCCTCRYLNNRTEFDRKQYLSAQKNSIDYGAKMFQTNRKKL